ncbi:DUF2938 domain-containing protein [Pelomonas sp. SE-A7]|uniref:DUF2938 domain-containing protein n=1 Tax=Pelomonas sp. SE-A7 TaxID=3054953 RepID=UPI00259D18CB|nr:DUF2938 domain-containing protein [Pelomonas sp. SE-A7]MDM4765239.1 DUF2938 domain-containing protein [Pelomonas sp. SE-A7]
MTHSLSLDFGIRIVLIGLGATAVLDLWLLLLNRLGVATQPFALIGRWVGHLWRGRVHHPAIAKAETIQGEALLGWLTHYAVGVVFAVLLAGAVDPQWMNAPTLLPAFALGVATVLAPFCLMQPAMGAGFAASKTPTPWKNRLKSLANHAVFGLGLFVSALALQQLAPLFPQS